MTNYKEKDVNELKSILLELFKGIITQLIYLYDLQFCADFEYPIYVNLNSKIATSVIGSKQATFNGITRDNIGNVIPIILKLEDNVFTNLKSLTSDARYILSLINSLVSIDACFGGYFKIPINTITKLSNDSYTLTKDLISLLNNILNQYKDEIGTAQEGEIKTSKIAKIAKTITTFDIDSIKYVLKNIITIIATTNLAVPTFYNAITAGTISSFVSMQFLSHTVIFLENINTVFKEYDNDYKIEFDNDLNQAKLLLNLKQDVYHGTIYDFHKISLDCRDYYQPEKCAYYSLKGREMNPSLEQNGTDLKIVVKLENDRQIIKFSKQLNAYCIYMSFLSEFHRLFTGDIIDIKNLNDTKITASIELLNAYKAIMYEVKKRKPSRKTQIAKLLNKTKKFAQIQTKKKSQQPTQGNNASTNPNKMNALKQLLQKIIDLCDNYLSNCESMGKKPENVIASYRNKLEKYKELCNQDNMNLQSATDIYIKLMDFTFKVYKLRATLFVENNYGLYAIYKYNGMQNNVKKLKLDISSNIIQENRKNSIQENRKNSGPKITSYHSSNDKPLVPQRMLAIEAPRTTPPVSAPRKPVSAQNKPPLPPKPRDLMGKPVTVVPVLPQSRKQQNTLVLREKTTGPLNANDPLPELPAKKKSDHINTPVVDEPIHDTVPQKAVSHKKKKGFLSWFTKKREMASISPPQQSKTKSRWNLKSPWTKKRLPGNNAKVASTHSQSNVPKSIKVPTQTTSEEKINNPETMYAQLQHLSTTPASEKEEVTYSELNHNPKSKKSSLRNSKKPMSTETSTTTNPVNIEGQNLNSAMGSNRKHQRNTISRKGESVRKREESIKEPNVKGLVQMFENRGKHKSLTPRGIRVRQH